jgi:Flp pilus assembly pilin Flp
MKQFLLKLWHDEEGAETAEWLVIVAMLVAIGLGVYEGTGIAGDGSLADGLGGLVGYITGQFPGAP